MSMNYFPLAHCLGNVSTRVKFMKLVIIFFCFLLNFFLVLKILQLLHKLQLEMFLWKKFDILRKKSTLGWRFKLTFFTFLQVFTNIESLKNILCLESLKFVGFLTQHGIYFLFVLGNAEKWKVIFCFWLNF